MAKGLETVILGFRLLSPGEVTALGQDFLDHAGGVWVEVRLICQGWTCRAEGVWFSAFVGRGQGNGKVVVGARWLRAVGAAHGTEPMHVGWGEGFVCFGHFGEDARRELDAGKEGAGEGSFDAAFAHGLEDDVDGGESRGPVDDEREVKRFHFCGCFFGWFGWELWVVMTAVFGGFGCGCVAALAVFECLKAST